jgi:ABC-2 type transport system permease protein
MAKNHTRRCSVPRRSVFAKSLRDDRWQIAGYGLSLAVMAALIIFIWPSYRNTLVNIDLPPALEALLGTDLSFATGPGFVSAEFFSWIPALLLVYAITKGTGAVAGEESAGTMDLLLAQPVRRAELTLDKVAAFLAGSVLIVFIGWLGFAISVPFIDIDVSLGDTFVASANMLPITWLFFALALWLGVVAPNRSTAAAVATGIAAAAYFTNALAAGVDGISWLRYASPFYYYGAGLPLVHGIDWAHAGGLSAVAALFIAMSLRAFQRRDVTLGGATSLRLADVLRRAV